MLVRAALRAAQGYHVAKRRWGRAGSGHGDRYRLIPLSQGQTLFKAAPQLKQFFLLQGCDHNDPYPADFYAALARFLK